MVRALKKKISVHAQLWPCKRETNTVARVVATTRAGKQDKLMLWVTQWVWRSSEGRGVFVCVLRSNINKLSAESQTAPLIVLFISINLKGIQWSWIWIQWSWNQSDQKLISWQFRQFTGDSPTTTDQLLQCKGTSTVAHELVFSPNLIFYIYLVISY